MTNEITLDASFFSRDVLDVAPDLIGKILVRKLDDGTSIRARITETEAYRGEEDSACHAHHGKTPRTEVMYREGGILYVYLIYGLHRLLNIVTGNPGEPQAVLIRACEDHPGPARLTRYLNVTGDLNRQTVFGPGLTVVDDGTRYEVLTTPRIGIDYATPEDRERPWRFIAGEIRQKADE